jgi:hypothetical protein
MIGAEKPVHYKRVFTITEFTINGIDCTYIFLVHFERSTSSKFNKNNEKPQIKI